MSCSTASCSTGPAARSLAAALVGILNALVWPALARLALPLNVLTLGLGGLVLNALLVGLVIDLLPGAAGRRARRPRS